ncbi:hypothetical protein [Labrenzia sp. VG12]|uniref:hypothetical protein n=1 Tax=Labrenzia sp. VG12 TaxID=2021862 RepID=UPI0012FE1C08|nr:hypothetical protein [Labrenzia sp. VG12]
MAGFPAAAIAFVSADALVAGVDVVALVVAALRVAAGFLAAAVFDAAGAFAVAVFAAAGGFAADFVAAALVAAGFRAVAALVAAIDLVAAGFAAAGGLAADADFLDLLEALLAAGFAAVFAAAGGLAAVLRVVELADLAAAGLPVAAFAVGLLAVAGLRAGFFGAPPLLSSVILKLQSCPWSPPLSWSWVRPAGNSFIHQSALNAPFLRCDRFLMEFQVLRPVFLVRTTNRPLAVCTSQQTKSVRKTQEMAAKKSPPPRDNKSNKL